MTYFEGHRRIITSNLLKLLDFDFVLPEDLIALRPAVPRSSARLLTYEKGQISDGYVYSLADAFKAGDRLIINNTKVIPARLRGERIRYGTSEGGRAGVEVTLMKQEDQTVWMAFIKPLKKVAVGEMIAFGHGLSAELLDKSEGQARLRFTSAHEDFYSALNKEGQMPLPHYIATKRMTDEMDTSDYQTIFAKSLGSVAAPTASLHFDAPVLEALEAKGIELSFVTLHVGAGTFLPVKVDDVKTHKMHAEYGVVNTTVAEDARITQKNGGRIIPVGTTALRLIETAAAKSGELQSWRGETDIFIYPGFDFKVTDALMTNFHLPKSTLLMLVSALIGFEECREVYAHAIKYRYRFLSYGDASLLVPNR